MVMSEEDLRRIKAIDDDIKELQECIYGDKNYVGLTTRIKVLEERLQIFWWALAAVGSTAIALVVRLIFRSLTGPQP